MNIQEINRAVKIHDYIEKLERVTGLSLKSSPVFLGLPSQKLTLQIPEFIKPCYEYVEQLYEGIADHDLLIKGLRTGWSYIDSDYQIIPNTKEEYFQQLNESYAFHIAKDRGYLVPCLQEKQCRYGQYEVYHAIHEIFHGNASGLWSSQFKSGNFMHSYFNWYKSVKLITSQFIIPSSGGRNTIPYILDQLWVVSPNPNQVRLLGLEIAGEQHLLNGGQSRTLGKEKYLNKLGYEMYYGASWWSRVDPYRVICEFLSVSGIFPDAVKYLVGGELNSIDEYVCGICSAPMVRWGWDWIQKCQVGNSTVLAHKHCVNHKLRGYASATKTADAKQ